MSRFDYVKYDDHAVKAQETFKCQVEELEKMIDQIGSTVKDPKAQIVIGWDKARAIEALEVCYMWIGKSLRDDQIARNEKPTELQEERKDS